MNNDYYRSVQLITHSPAEIHWFFFNNKTQRVENKYNNK